MSYIVRRTILLTYDSEERYREDRTHWSMPEGEGNFGPSERWWHQVETEDDWRE